MEFECIDWEKRRRAARQRQTERVRKQIAKTRWFAWYPVQVSNGAGKCVWLEFVWRYGSMSERWGNGFEKEWYVSSWQYYKLEDDEDES